MDIFNLQASCFLHSHSSVGRELNAFHGFGLPFLHDTDSKSGNIKWDWLVLAVNHGLRGFGNNDILDAPFEFIGIPKIYVLAA